MFCFNSFYASVNTIWSVAPPVYIILILTAAAFFMGVVGFRSITNRLTALRSWFTVLTSLFLSIILLAVVLFLPDAKQLIKTTHSSNDHYTINFYLTNGGAATSLGMIGELNGPLWFKKTIYSDYNMGHANIEWKNDVTISINSHVLHLNKGETYSDS